MTADMLPEFAEQLIPPGHDRSTVAHRKAELRARLEAAGIAIVDTFEAGSFSHGTGVKDHADVDNMVWVKLEQRPQWPSTILGLLREALRPLGVRSVTVTTPAVRIEYLTPPHFEVVPAFYNGTKDDVIVFEIPGRRDEWVVSAPEAHNALVNVHNDRLGKKLKPLVRLLKAWKYYADVQLSSFYIEMRTTEYARDEKSILYEIDLKRVLRAILSKDLADMNDPSGIVGRIPACSSDEAHRSARSAMRAALDNLEPAQTYRAAGDTGNYWIAMSRVFGTSFPWPAR